MQISTRRHNKVTILDLSGDIDFANSPELRHSVLREIQESRTPRVVINLSKVHYIDSSGVASLVEGLKACRDLGAAISLRASKIRRDERRCHSRRDLHVQGARTFGHRDRCDWPLRICVCCRNRNHEGKRGNRRLGNNGNKPCPVSRCAKVSSNGGDAALLDHLGHCDGHSRWSTLGRNSGGLHLSPLRPGFDRLSPFIRPHHRTSEERDVRNHHYSCRVSRRVVHGRRGRAGRPIHHSGRGHVHFSGRRRRSVLHRSFLFCRQSMSTTQMFASPQTEPAISLRNLRVSYGTREILHGISFDVLPGETLVILGGSGSGKSTLLRTLVCLEKPPSGEIFIKGQNLPKTSAAKLDAIRKKIAIPFHGGAPFWALTPG